MLFSPPQAQGQYPPGPANSLQNTEATFSWQKESWCLAGGHLYLFSSSSADWQKYLAPHAVQHQEILTMGQGITSLVYTFSIKSVKFRQTMQ